MRAVGDEVHLGDASLRAFFVPHCGKPIGTPLSCSNGVSQAQRKHTGLKARCSTRLLRGIYCCIVASRIRQKHRIANRWSWNATRPHFRTLPTHSRTDKNIKKSKDPETPYNYSFIKARNQVCA